MAPGRLDARLCLSYQTIENRGSIPHELRGALGEWVFGCDVCSEVCPWGQRAPDASETFGTHPRVAEGSLLDWLRTPEEAFPERFNGSPLQRPKRAGLARNAALVLGNLPSDEGREGLLEALDDPAPRVREAAFWALARGHRRDAGVAPALDAALARERDPEAAADMRTTLQRPPGDPGAT